MSKQGKNPLEAEIDGMYKALFKMSKQMTSLEGKVEEIKHTWDLSAIEDTLGHLVTRMDLVVKRVDKKIDNQGLVLVSIKRVME